MTLTNASPVVSISSPGDLTIVSVGAAVALIAPVSDPGTISGNSATWAGTGRWNGQSGFRYQVRIRDRGTGRSKRPSPDSFSIVVRNAAGVIILDVGGPLGGGNLKIH